MRNEVSPRGHVGPLAHARAGPLFDVPSAPPCPSATIWCMLVWALRHSGSTQEPGVTYDTCTPGGQLARSTVVQQPLPIPTLSTESSVMPDPHRKTRPPSRCPGLWVTHPDSWRRTVPVAPILVEIGARRPFFPLGDDWCFLQGAPGRSESAIICCFRGRQGV